MEFTAAGGVTLLSVTEVDVLDVTGSFVSSPSFEVAATMNLLPARRTCGVARRKHREAGQTRVLELESFGVFNVQESGVATEFTTI